MDEQAITRYADVVVEVGMNVQPDQIVAVHGPLEAAPFVRAIARASYRRGAKFVDAIYFDAAVKRVRLEEATEDTLDFVPRWYGERLLAFRDDHVARCSITPMVPPGVLEGVDPTRAGKDQMPFLKETFTVINAMTTNWTVVGWPATTWARHVHPEVDEEAAVERLWRDIGFVCRLDTSDPVAAWQERYEGLRAASTKLNDRLFDALHFEGEGTDLTVGLLPESRWSGGTFETADGIVHGPNIPTEEVATAPDPQRVDGLVRATKPLDVSGTVVRGLRVRFEGGRAVEIEADENADVLRGRAALDEGASRLGEVALVDRSGRVGQVDTPFLNTLFDENAASHIALGNAYEFSARGAEDRINTSAIHIDFMIGGDDVAVTGITRDGERVPVLRGGDWQI